jgi:hypothetical protein
LGFENPNTPNAKFIEMLAKAGESGVPCKMDKSSDLMCTTNTVTNKDSRAFGKIVANVSVVLSAGNEKSICRIDMGTLAAIVAGNGSATIKVVPVLRADSTPYLLRDGSQLYNFRATSVPKFEPEVIDKISAWVAKFQKTATPNTPTTTPTPE